MTTNTCKGVTVKGERCKLEPVNNYTSYINNLLCLKNPKDMCYLHCDCDNCSKRQRTFMQGIYYTDTASINKKIKVIKKRASDYQKNYEPQKTTKKTVTEKALLNKIKQETNLDILRSVACVLAEDHPDIFKKVIKSSKKRLANIKVLEKINYLQTEIDKLKEELK